MKKTVRILLALMLLLSLSAQCLAAETSGNFTNEMKIPHTIDLSEADGADSVDRVGDHVGSPYFAHPDIYAMESTDTLTILPRFKTQQQTSEWSCGPSAALMVLNYFGKLGDHNEDTLAAFRSLRANGKGGTEPSATTLQQMIDIFEGIGGFDIVSTRDLEASGEAFTLSALQAFLAEGCPVLIGWNDWGGHWQVAIGYDTMGTESEMDDVMIVADPYDTSDHNQDGYGIYGAQRFYYNFTFYDFFTEEEGNDAIFLAVKPAA